MLLVSIVPPMTEMGFHQISLVFFVVVVGGGRSLPAASRLVRSLWTGCSFFSFFFYRVDSFYFNGPVMSGGERPCSFFFSFFVRRSVRFFYCSRCYVPILCVRSYGPSCFLFALFADSVVGEQQRKRNLKQKKNGRNRSRRRRQSNQGNGRSVAIKKTLNKF